MLRPIPVEGSNSFFIRSLRVSAGSLSMSEAEESVSAAPKPWILWLPYAGSDVLLCLDVHGQMVYVDRPAGVVAAKLSSWPEPQHPWKLFSTLAAFDAISVSLA